MRRDNMKFKDSILKRGKEREMNNQKTSFFTMKKMIIVGTLVVSIAALCCNKKPEQTNTLIALNNPEILNPNVDSDKLFYAIPEAPLNNNKNNAEVSSEELINALEYLCYAKTKCEYYYLKWNQMLSESYDYLSSNFISITSDYYFVFDENNKPIEQKSLPFYFNIDGVYTINIHYLEAQGETEGIEKIIQVDINKEELEPILEHLGIPKFEVTREYLEQLGLIESYNPLIGALVYDGTQELNEEVLYKITDPEIRRILENFVNKQTNRYIDRINKTEEAYEEYYN